MSPLYESAAFIYKYIMFLKIQFEKHMDLDISITYDGILEQDYKVAKLVKTNKCLRNLIGNFLTKYLLNKSPQTHCEVN